MANSLQFTLRVKNRSTKKALIFKSVDLQHGNFNNTDVCALYPVKVIPPNSNMEVMCATGAENSATGTEGTVIYTVEGTNESVSVYWDIPWTAGSQNRSLMSSSDEKNVIWAPQHDSDYGRTLTTEVTFVWLGD